MCLKSINDYFPHTFTRKTHPAKLNMAMFSPFNQADWPMAGVLRGNFVAGSIKEVSMALNIPYDNQLQKEFQNLIESILGNIVYCMNRKSDSFYFWLTVLKDFGNNISPRLQRLIKSVIIIPFSSSEAERAFSLMGYIKSKSRNRMATSTLTDHMRLAINAPKIMDAKEYTVEYLKKHDPCDHSSSVEPYYEEAEMTEEDAYADELEEWDRFEDILLTGKASFY